MVKSVQSSSALVKQSQRVQKQWNVVNTTTIIEWISASNLNILLLNTYLINLRSILRFSTLWSLVISSVTSTISVTQFTITDTENIYLSYAIKLLIFITSVTTSLITGYIKVEKIQETIEILEEHKKNWLSFMNSLTSELQVGIEFRNDATVLINAKKDEYNTVSSKQIEIPPYIHKQVSQFLVTKRNVEKHIQEVKQRQEIEDLQYNRVLCGANIFEYFCCSICCCFYWFRYCCKSRCCSKTENDYNMEKIATKLSLFHTINKDLMNELLELMNVFQDEVKGLAFDKQNDMFNYEIITNRYMKDMIAEKQGLTVLKLKSDDQGVEDDDDDIERAKSSQPVYNIHSSIPVVIPTDQYRTNISRCYDAKQSILKTRLMRNSMDKQRSIRNHLQGIYDVPEDEEDEDEDDSESTSVQTSERDRESSVSVPPLPPSVNSSSPNPNTITPTMPISQLELTKIKEDEKD